MKCIKPSSVLFSPFPFLINSDSWIKRRGSRWARPLLLIFGLILTACGGNGGSDGGVPLVLDDISRVSVDDIGNEGNDTSFDSSISWDGRYVAFASDASNLVAGDTNSTADVFVHDTVTAMTTRVSVDDAGNESNDRSTSSLISWDGRYVAFTSSASNLVAGDTNSTVDVFVHDTVTATTTRVSMDDAGTEGNDISFGPSISGNGRYVAFGSFANNLVTGDTNGAVDIFVHDTVTETTTRVSVDDAGNEGNDVSTSSFISGDGRYVAFASDAENLVVGDTNSTADIFVHDTVTETTTRVSVDDIGTEANSTSFESSISGDGRYVAFTSDASNLVAGDSNMTADVFVHDIVTAMTTRVSVDDVGTSGNNHSFDSSISGDGRYVAFESRASNLVVGDINGFRDIFIHDTVTAMTTRVSVDDIGTEGNAASFDPSISGDGHYVAFESGASNLVTGDTNGAQDVFRAPNQP